MESLQGRLSFVHPPLGKLPRSLPLQSFTDQELILGIQQQECYIGAIKLHRPRKADCLGPHNRELASICVKRSFDAGEIKPDTPPNHIKDQIMKLLPVLFLLTMPMLTMAQDTANPNSSSNGQDDKPYNDALAEKGFWQGTLPGGSYMVALNRISSISKHEYLLDGNLIVTEVTIDTIGSSILRVYQITPAAQYGTLATGRKIVERGRDLLDRAGQRTGADIANMVQKQYPTTTHARTVEFRVKDLGTLDALLNSARNALLSGKGRKFVVNE